MGCDIHLYREKHVAGKWVNADEWPNEYSTPDVSFKKRFTNRNYNLFSVLADVRTRETPPYQFHARGMPLAASPEVAAAWAGGFDHSESHLYLHELKELRALLGAATITISGMKNIEELQTLRASAASSSPDWSLLYPYCQGTNDPKQVEFSIEVPADYIVGSDLDEIIASISDIGGDNQRIVFWFDS
jgi:hypothetical protein